LEVLKIKSIDEEPEEVFELGNIFIKIIHPTLGKMDFCVKPFEIEFDIGASNKEIEEFLTSLNKKNIKRELFCFKLKGKLIQKNFGEK